MSKKEEFLAQYGSAEHATKAVNSSDDELQYAGSQNPNLPKEQMERLSNDDDAWAGHIGLSLNGNTPTNVVDKLAHHKDGEVQRNALIHTNVSKSTVRSALRDTSVWSDAHERLVKSSPHITKDDLEYVIRTGRFGTQIRDIAKERMRDFK